MQVHWQCIAGVDGSRENIMLSLLAWSRHCMADGLCGLSGAWFIVRLQTSISATECTIYFYIILNNSLFPVKYILSSVDNNCRIPGLPPLPNSGQGSELDWYSIKSNSTSVQKLLKENRKQGILLTEDDVKRATLEARLKEWEEIEEVHREMIFDDVGPQERCGKLGLGSNHSDNPKRIYEILSTQVHTAGQACTWIWRLTSKLYLPSIRPSVVTNKWLHLPRVSGEA